MSYVMLAMIANRMPKLHEAKRLVWTMTKLGLLAQLEQVCSYDKEKRAIEDRRWQQLHLFALSHMRPPKLTYVTFFSNQARCPKKRQIGTGAHAAAFTPSYSLSFSPF